MQMVAAAWLVLRLAGSGIALGIDTALAFGPILLLGAWGGTLADRHDKRTILLITQVVLRRAGARAVGDRRPRRRRAVDGVRPVVRAGRRAGDRQPHPSELLLRDGRRRGPPQRREPERRGHDRDAHRRPCARRRPDRRRRDGVVLPDQRGLVPRRDRRAADDADRRPASQPRGSGAGRDPRGVPLHLADRRPASSADPDVGAVPVLVQPLGADPAVRRADVRRRRGDARAAVLGDRRRVAGRGAVHGEQDGSERATAWRWRP